MFRYITAIVAIAAAPRNVAADSNPARLRLHGTPETDFDRGVDPATLIAAKTSSRELSSTIVWSAPEGGLCRNSTSLPSYSYRYAVKSPIPTTPSLEDWCKAWCNQVEPDKVVGIEIGVFSTSTSCGCLFSADDLPSLLEPYNPAATGVITSNIGVGCITGTVPNPSITCYRNCSYKQCIGESGYDSCRSSNPSSQPSSSQTPSLQPSSSKSGKSSSSGPEAGKGSFAGGAGSGDLLSEASAIDPVLVDDPMLLAAEGSFSMPTEFNEWGDEFNEGDDIVSMSMENEESTIGV